MYQLRPIGKIMSDTNHTVIEVESNYRRALKNLDQFSHAHVFYSHYNEQGWKLRKKIINIQTINIKRGLIIVANNWNLFDEGCLFDIKPYFPSEDSVKGAMNTKEYDKNSEMNLVFTNESFEIESKGFIRNVKGEIYVQLNEVNIVNIVENTYIKLYWWFHKFDSDKYRGITECNPPYENSKRTGIFSTRSPVRPNPIAMTIVKVVRVDYERRRLYIDGIESFDKTPCLGYLPYLTDEDRILKCTIPDWLSHWPKWVDENKDVKTENSNSLETLLKRNQPNKWNHHPVDVDHKDCKDTVGIVVQGARENNLKGIDVVIPYGKITAVVGVSGSGKSSLVNDTIYAECRRRMEYLTNNRNLLQKPSIESMRGCIPAVIVDQHAIRGNSFSTIGTYTNAYDYLRIVYANAAIRHCSNCGGEIIPLSRESIIQLIQSMEYVEIFDLKKVKLYGETIEDLVDTALICGEGAFYVKFSDNDFILLQTKQKCYRCNHLMFEMTPQTFSYMDIDSRCPVCSGTGKIMEIDQNKIIDNPHLSLLDGASSFYGKLRKFLDLPNANWMKGQVFGLADEMKVNLEKPWNELDDAFKQILLHGSGENVVTFHYKNSKNGRNGEITRPVEGIYQIISRIRSDDPDTKALDRYLSQLQCNACHGERLSGEGRTATVTQVRYPQAAAMSFYDILEFCNNLYENLSDVKIKKVESAIQSLKEIANVAVKLGIGYLNLNRETTTLSGGERQRLKLLGAFVNHMTGILYVFDEPSKGLHPKDYDKVIMMLQNLKMEGNTIIMVDHNEDMIKTADTIIEIGPAAGKRGGLLVGEGTIDAMLNHRGTQISKYMNPHNEYRMPYSKQDLVNHPFIKIEQVAYRNLKNISIRFPQNAFTCICGVSGSGKSSLMKGVIFEQAKKKLHYSDVVMVDQLSIGKTSKSIIATYTGIMDMIRMEYSLTRQAQEKKFDEKYFSFNRAYGQCLACNGEGRIRVKFMEDIYVKCPDCNGKRYQRKILGIQYQDKNIDEVLNMSIDEAILFWIDIDEIVLKLKALQKTGLGYLLLGQSTSSLSGGEAARLKLSKELVTKTNNNILYLLDEPTTGLHFSDIEHLLELISEIVRNGNTVIAIEHNKHFLNNCDWLIELGPGAGDAGGLVINQGQIGQSESR
ncbi:MAG: TrmO family methyltransferase [Velocimicrobium sp.]